MEKLTYNTIYLNPEKSKLFKIPYTSLADLPRGYKIMIHTGALYAYDPDSWDKKHRDILLPPRCIWLKPMGYGWWEVLD